MNYGEIRNINSREKNAKDLLAKIKEDHRDIVEQESKSVAAIDSVLLVDQRRKLLL